MEDWAKKKKKEEAENQFQRLSDDVVLNIFNKVSDVKWLFRCLVISKRFSSLIPLVQTLSFTTNAWGWDYLSFPRHVSDKALVKGSLGEFPKLLITNSLLETFLYLHEPHLLPSLSLNASGLVLLAKSTRVRSLNLDIVSDFNAHNDSLFKWGAKLTSKLDGVTFLCAASFSKMMKSEEEEDDDEEEIENEITHEELICRVNLAINCLREAALRLGIMSHFITEIPSLQSITITDSNNKGMKLCLGGDKLVECVNAFALERAFPLTESWTGKIMRVGYVPVLRLPMSGYVMKRVTIVHFNLYGADDSDAKTAMLDAFAEEQGVFSEAVVQILENCKDSVKAMFQN